MSSRVDDAGLHGRRQFVWSGAACVALSSDEQPEVFTRFVYKPNWFVLSQTDGVPIDEPIRSEWDRDRALGTLNIVEQPFTLTDGNVQGYACRRSIAVSPLAELPAKTRFHEI